MVFLDGKDVVRRMMFGRWIAGIGLFGVDDEYMFGDIPDRLDCDFDSDCER